VQKVFSGLSGIDGSVFEVDVEQLMERLGRAGVMVILKVDEERLRECGRPWTLVLSGPGLGGRAHIRTEAVTLRECLREGVTQLRQCPGDWDWLTDSVGGESGV
jgi:hypothetical protein